MCVCIKHFGMANIKKIKLIMSVRAEALLGILLKNEKKMLKLVMRTGKWKVTEVFYS
jgi:hypothetical protein